MNALVIACLMVFLSANSFAATYRCEVQSATIFDTSLTVQVLSKTYLKGRQQHVIIEDGTKSFVQRCSLNPLVGKVECDRYEADRVTKDANINFKKFYFFKSQFDVQLLSDLSFIENNGRGGLAYGQCKLINP
jgi:hypothetical protein